MGFLFLSAALGITQDVCNKKYAVNFGKYNNSNYLLIGFGTMVAVICRLIVSDIIILPMNIMLFAILQSVLILVLSLPLIKAFNNGPIVSINLVMQCLSYISVAYGIMVYGDEVNVLSVMAAILFLVVLLLLSPPKDEKQKTNGKWFIYAIIAGTISALSSCVQKTVSELGNSEYMEGYVLWHTLFVALGGIIVFIVKRPYKQKDFLTTLSERKLSTTAIILLYGICGGFNAFVQLKALSTVSILIVYPTLWGLSVIITPIISLVYFHDLKLSLKNVSAIVLGLLATMLNVFA